MEKSTLSDNRQQLVVKSNDLIQRTRYDLSLQEQKIVLYVISKIKPTDEELQEYSFTMRELCEMCGIEAIGQNFENMWQSIVALNEKTIEFEDNRYRGNPRWIEMPIMDKLTREIRIRFHPLLRPYLIALHENFTQYELSSILIMRSRYSVRMYELLKSYAYLDEITFSLEELKEKLQTTGYSDYKNFRVRVLEKAIEEINEHTDIRVEFKPIRTSRVITHLRFIIKRKSSAEQVMLRAKRNAALDAKES
jgi:plasmid replication initiation protein